MARAIEPLVRPNKKPESFLPSWEENYEEYLRKSLFEDQSPDDEERPLNVVTDGWVHHERPGEEWDVPLSEEIHYFDPELSYELTGYRPITMEKGLDFDPAPFSAVGQVFDQKGRYTEFPKGSKPFRDFWVEQRNRCENGYTVGKYRLTGDHYFFLNFYRMKIAVERDRVGQGRSEGFPAFASKQYEWFHYLEMCERLKMDACCLKGRGVGFSEIGACLAVRPYTTVKGYRTLLTCAADQKLEPLRNKCWTQLNFLDMKTDGAFKHLRQVKNSSTTKRASMLTPAGEEYGWGSEIDSVVADSPDKIRGDRCDRLIYEECFGKGTRVLMADYSIKNIEDIKVGDFVMGVDGTPQEVEGTCNGIDTLYKVRQRKGSDYIVNSKHLLYTEFRPRIGGWKDRIEQLTCPEYLSLSDYYKRTHYGLKSSGLYRSNQHLEIDPYWFGLWLGDGFSSGATIVINETDDCEIKDFVVKYYQQLLDKNTHITIRKNNCHTQKTLNDYSLSSNDSTGTILRTWLKEHDLLNNKHIPDYIYNLDMEDRLKILAGIIDTDGNLKKGSSSYSFSYEIAMSREALIKEIQQLARSCGFDTTFNSRTMYNSYKKDSISYRVVIRGDLRRIPVKVERKKLPDDYVQTTNALSTAIQVEKLQPGEYYGITLKEYGKQIDHLFLLEDYTIVHNCGSNTKLIKSWVQGDSLVNLGDVKVGLKVAFGTGGDDVALGGLSDIFTHPLAYNVLPFKNTDTDDGKPELTGFFLPSHKMALTSKYVDSRGVTDHVRFKEFYKDKRKKLTSKALIDECAEHCFTPREALIKHGDNMFDSTCLSQRLMQLKVGKEGSTLTPMSLLWDKTVGNGMEKVNAFEDKNSKLLVAEPPIVDDSHAVYKDLYVAGIDSIDMGETDSASYTDVSEFCIIILKRVFGMEEPRVVAMYKDRPKNIRDAYDLSMKLLTWYNCKAMLEYTRISIIQYFTEKKKQHLFMSRPAFAIGSASVGVARKAASNKRLIGVPSTPAVINHGLELVGNFITDYWYTIDYEELIDQMLNYTLADKRKFDCIAAMQMVMLGDEALTGIQPTSAAKSIQNTWQDFGYYTDADGYKRYGVIPKTSW